ncbi:imelysin family protein [Pedobacter aquatilis]|uniref:imelysin family protein n=1 Tax=Pedobacter aquatilis TaxID=351343 RepID=UPI00292CAF01|nr:imelysin family protein [Pedobacter aquatilis]
MGYFKTKQIFSVLVLLTFGLLYACSKNGEGPAPEPTDNSAKNRKELLTNIADNIVLPAYANFKVKLDAMVSKSNAFTTTPTAATLTDFRAAWVDAYIEWQKVELFDFGPGQTEAIRTYINIYPANVAGINSNIAAGASANLEFTSSIATQGFPAIDYLINGTGVNDADILSYFTTTTDATKRKDYLKRVVDRINILFTKVNTSWSTYRDQFVAASGSDASSSISVMVNSYVLNYERFIRSGKFGIPSGAMMNGVVAADKVEAFYKKDISLSLAKAAQQASIDFFNGKSVKTGTEGASFKTYLDALGAKDSKTGTKLSQIILDQFAASTAKLNLLSQNFFSEVSTSNQKMIDVYTEMQKSVRMLKVDMTSAMSITITYTDNDGD